MRFFSVYDVIKFKQKQIGHTDKDLFAFFRRNHISKVTLLDTVQSSGVIPTEGHLLTTILEYLCMTQLELTLCLGRIPNGYEKSFIENIKTIANLLEKESISELNQQSNCSPYFTTELGRLYNGDCLKLFYLIEDNSVDCVFADPPFNLNKEYDKGVDDKKCFSEYISWCIDWLDECVRVLKPGGSLFIYNIPKWHTYLSNYLNEKLNFWDWIGVDMKFSLPISNRLYPAHYSLLYYVKGNKPSTFNPQRIPLQTCRHCGGELKDYGGYKNKMNPNGVNVSDIWSDIYPVRHNNSKNRKYNELPVKLLDRVISMSTNENDLILDPFGGSGTTYAVSELLNRRWVGFEIGNSDVIRERLTDKASDKRLLEKVYEEKNKLFPDKVKVLRRTNGFWLDEDFERLKTENS